MSLWISIVIVVGLSAPAFLLVPRLHETGQPTAGLVPALAIGSIVCLASLYPYWLFGSASAIGWYDEYDAIIPAYLMQISNSSPFNFSHSFAGGTEVRAAYADIGSAYFDLYRTTLEAFGGPLGAFLLRLVGTILLCAGIVVTARLFLKAPPWVAVVAGLAAVFSSAYPYAWLLGAYGWDFALMVWAPLLFLADIGRLSRLGLATLYAVIAAASATLVFFLPWVVLYTILVTVQLRRRPWAVFVQNLPEILLIGLIVGLANIPSIQAVLASLQQSGRFLRLTGPESMASILAGQSPPGATLAEVLHQIWIGMSGTLLRGHMAIFGRGLQGFPPTVFFSLLATLAAVWLTVQNRTWRYAVIVLVPSALAIGFTFASEMFRLPVVSAYRWDLLYLCLPFLFSLILAECLRDLSTAGKVSRRVSRISSLGLVAAAFLGAASLAERAVDDLDSSGGWAILTQYPDLGKLANMEPLTRAVSVPGYLPKPMLGPNYGLDVLDGVRRNFTWRRIAFWFETLQAEPTAKWHTHRHALGRNLASVNLDALRLANTGIILSTAKIDSPEVALERRLTGIRLRDIKGFYFQTLAFLLPDISLAPDLFVYRIEGAWDRVFAPSSLIQEGAMDTNLEYFENLRNLPRQSILVAGNAPDWLRNRETGKLQIASVRKTPTGLNLATDSQGGLLVYNQEFTENWRAMCGDVELPLAPINAVQMITDIPAGCTRIRFVYQP